MIETIAAFLLAQKLRKILEEKGRPVWRYIIPGILLLMIGEFVGVTLALTLDLDKAGAILFGIFGLAIGGYTAYYLVDRLEPIQEPETTEL
ncbi:MAG: hypothetical protein H6662_16715 [Ardenticatenaceae bacterium]|nr:hypothetical protein [Anaerolineales bacterium]MCB8923232.1 hypothetical protein [Ardenticatenaceae bacterium]MCB9004823.1 hypothetical protein [Ardenticatenaceae bacterium]